MALGVDFTPDGSIVAGPRPMISTVLPGLQSLIASVSWLCAIEHRWAISLRDTINKTGGRTLADAWIDPDDPVLARLE